MQFWHFLNCNYHTQKNLFFRFGPIVRSTYDVSSWKVYNFLRHDVGIKKIHTCWCCTRNPVELEHFECSLVFFLPNLPICLVFFSSELIISDERWFSKCTLKRKWPPSVPWTVTFKMRVEYTRAVILTLHGIRGSKSQEVTAMSIFG